MILYSLIAGTAATPAKYVVTTDVEVTESNTGLADSRR
jgi:hypothetical protein